MEHQAEATAEERGGRAPEREMRSDWGGVAPALLVLFVGSHRSCPATQRE